MLDIFFPGESKVFVEKCTSLQSAESSPGTSNNTRAKVCLLSSLAHSVFMPSCDGKIFMASMWVLFSKFGRRLLTPLQPQLGGFRLDCLSSANEHSDCCVTWIVQQDKELFSTSVFTLITFGLFLSFSKRKIQQVTKKSDHIAVMQHSLTKCKKNNKKRLLDNFEGKGSVNNVVTLIRFQGRAEKVKCEFRPKKKGA